MTHLRTLALVVMAFALGTAVASFASLQDYAWTGPEAAMAACSAFLLVAWFVSTWVNVLKHTPRVRLLAVSLVLNAVLLCGAAYVGLGFRRDAYSLRSRTEAGLSLISPRLLSRFPIQVFAYSPTPAADYEVEDCWLPGETPGFLGRWSITSDSGIENASVTEENRSRVLEVTFRGLEWNRLSEFEKRHPGTAIAFVVPCPTGYGKRVLLAISGRDVAKPVTTSLVLFKLSGVDGLQAQRFRLWVRRAADQGAGNVRMRPNSALALRRSSSRPLQGRNGRANPAR